MSYRKYRWSKDYEAAEEELELLLESMASENIDRFALAAFEEIASKSSRNARRIWCAEGSIVFRIDDKQVSVQPGDALDLLPGSNVGAVAGIAGCVYYEARA